MLRRKKAFTLAELIIVVLIIGVMALVAIPRMNFSILTSSKAQTIAEKITAAIRETRSLAIANAATSTQGFSLTMSGSGNYTSFSITDVNSGQVVETGSIDTSVTCTGASSFLFGPLGNRLSDANGLTVSAGGKTYGISVTSATGMVICVKQ